ncbi:MAG: TIGR03545 family protein [Gemmatimonadales bacterium]|jgi:uncharacterized protein (TIGR03545 family)
MKLFRWKAIVPLTIVLVLIGVAWWLYSDRLIEHSIEDFGADLVGARVDVEEADLSLAEGRLRIVGLAAANPNSPMRNLFEAREIVADIRTLPLLKKKLLIEQVSVRGVRFGTERTESGELDDPSRQSGQLVRTISGWADRVRIPPLNLEGLNTVVNVAAIAAESLTTYRRAHSTIAFADSTRVEWEAQLLGLNPKPLIDSAQALVNRLNNVNPLTLGVTGVTQLASSSRDMMSSLTSLTSRVTSLDSTVRGGMDQLLASVNGLADARQADYDYARGLLRLPSLDSPDLSAGLFGDMAVARLEPVLYWVNQAGRYLPPGLDPRRRPGPKRPRRAGVTVKFPDRDGDPSFLVETADADLEIGGEGAAAGMYAGRITGLTSEPAILGEPLTAMIERTGAAVGPTDVRLGLVMDHTGPVIRDSGSVAVAGVSLPEFDIGGIDAHLDLGQGASNLSLSRVGDSIAGTWVWRSGDVRWTRGAGSGEQGAGIGAMAQDFLWQTLADIDDVEITVRFSGSPAGPSLRIGSNVGRAVAASLRRQLGDRIEQAQREVYAQVNRLVDPYVTEAQTKAETLQSEVADVVGVRLDEVTEVRAELERALRRLVPRP